MGKMFDEIKIKAEKNSRLKTFEKEMKPEDYADLIAALKDKTISAPAIKTVLGKRGYMIAVSTLTLIRREMK